MLSAESAVVLAGTAAMLFFGVAFRFFLCGPARIAFRQTLMAVRRVQTHWRRLRDFFILGFFVLNIIVIVARIAVGKVRLPVVDRASAGVPILPIVSSNVSLAIFFRSLH